MLSTDRSLGHLAEDSSASRQSDRRPRQGIQCAISHSGKCSSDLESALALASHGGKLFYYEANIFRLMRRQALLSVLRYQYSTPRVPPMPQSINNLRICPSLSEFAVLLANWMHSSLASAHDHRVDNSN